jgi:acyl-CoA synthetase (AMP-forming)/AMP-acid ligase II
VTGSQFAVDLAACDITWFSAVPTLLRMLIVRASDDSAECATSLRFARTSSAALPLDLISRFEALFQTPLVEAYGMTEASHQMASNPLPPAERRPGSVGLPTGTDISILNDDWQTCQPDERGEIAVRGPGVIDAYLDNPAANEASFRQGWFRTGDLGTRSPDGYVTIVGRIKELINRGGEKIAPPEVDEALLSHAAVTDAVAYGVPDAKYGEIVHAAVVVGQPVEPDELIRHCGARIESFKVPARVIIVKEIPKSPTGKVQRSMLATRLAE